MSVGSGGGTGADSLLGTVCVRAYVCVCVCVHARACARGESRRAAARCPFPCMRSQPGRCRVSPSLLCRCAGPSAAGQAAVPAAFPAPPPPAPAGRVSPGVLCPSAPVSPPFWLFSGFQRSKDLNAKHGDDVWNTYEKGLYLPCLGKYRSVTCSMIYSAFSQTTSFATCHSKE